MEKSGWGMDPTASDCLIGVGNMKLLVLIPARRGSKRLLGKNRRLLLDRPLIEYTIDAARKSRYCKNFDLLCSTDDKEIAKIARANDCPVPFLRPKRLASDKASSMDVILHALSYMENVTKKKYDYVVLLQPTSPLRTARHLDEAITKALRYSCDSVISVVQSHHFLHNLRYLNDDDTLSDIVLRENGLKTKLGSKIFAVNGAIYITQRDVIVKQKDFYGKRSLPYLMNKQASVDIDTLEDFQLAEFFMQKRNNCKTRVNK